MLTWKQLSRPSGAIRFYLRGLAGYSENKHDSSAFPGTPLPNFTSMIFHTNIYTGNQLYVGLEGENLGSDPSALIWLLGDGGVTVQTIPPVRDFSQLTRRRVLRVCCG
jgi:hypothetical protein